MTPAMMTNADAWLARIREKTKDLPPIDYACSACCDQKYHYDDEGRRRRRCRECNRAYAAGLPVPLRTLQLADVREHTGNRLALERARAFIAGGRSDLFIFGPVGTGKTYLAAAIANAVCDRADNIAALFVRWPMTLHRLSPDVLTAPERSQLETELTAFRTLVLDDLGAERDLASDFTRRTAYLVYEQRGDDGLRTVITSNLSLDQLARHFGDDRLTSRIAGRADVVEITGEDQRVRLSRDIRR
jgi:DNA replication protein DnaC